MIYATLSEEELVRKVVEGEDGAEEFFFSSYRPRLLRACSYLLGHQDADAEDIVQETFMVALPKLKDYVFKAPIFAWLRQISVRLCYARLRKRGRMLVAPESSLEHELQRKESALRQDQDQEAREAMDLATLNRLRLELGPEARAVIELRRMHGMSYAKISRCLHIPLGTVMSRIARAKGRLRAMAAAENADATT